MTRHDDKHSGITNIRHNDGVDRWLVVRRKLTKAKEVPSLKQLPKATNHDYKMDNLQFTGHKLNVTEYWLVIGDFILLWLHDATLYKQIWVTLVGVETSWLEKEITD